MLPFDLTAGIVPDESLKLSEDLIIPRLGSLTVEEAILLPALHQLSNNDILASQITIATVFLKCRLGNDWTVERVAELPRLWIEAIAIFALNEQLRWELPTAKRAGSGRSRKSKPINWAEIWWKLQRYFPHEPRFSRANFAKCPVWIMEQALDVADHLEVERVGLESRAIANVGVLLAAANQVKAPQSRMFNDCEYLLYRERAKDEVEPEVAQSLLHLHKLGKVPEWVCEELDLDLYKASASWGGEN